jgi:uncharacterized protein HemX
MASRFFRKREAERQARQEKTIAIALVLMVGLGIGAVLVWLLASRGEHDLRAEIAENVEDAVHSLEQEMADLRRRLEDRAS